MTLADFEQSVQSGRHPAGLGGALEALWEDAHGDWEKAHQHAQDAGGVTGAWVHAYLHRKEGDLSNAAYWYRQAGKQVAAGPLPDEWRSITSALLKQSR